jgi:hypothetical protein
MDEAVNELVIAPFKELVEKANTALQNAEDADPEAGEPMQKAAKNLAKEGERALKRIEPLCDKIFQEFGSAFVDALKENGNHCASFFVSTPGSLCAKADPHPR